MTTDYNAIAGEYQAAKRQPWRSAIEAHSLAKLAGDLRGLSVIDLACGEGHYSRLAKLRGARRVLGVDLSAKMIELGREQEAAQPLGVEYAVGDCGDLELPEKFDLALAAYLLNYARTAEELAHMARSVAACLPPGGRFVTVNSSPLVDFRRAASYRPYGFELELGVAPDREGRVPEGTPICWRFFLERETLEIENYYLSPETHERALAEAGLADVKWARPELAAGAERPDGYWDAFLEHPPITLLTAVRSRR